MVEAILLSRESISDSYKAEKVICLGARMTFDIVDSRTTLVSGKEVRLYQIARGRAPISGLWNPPIRFTPIDL